MPENVLVTDTEVAIAPALSDHSLYMHHLCYFCAKVEHAIGSMALNIEFKNILQNPEYREELVKEGGSQQVPCLRIETAGQSQWMYESNAIIAYLSEVGTTKE
ncbi:MAG: glutaredoxin [Proteobacteria bacterium]|mgnify:FL=1|jgi:glutaredoxin 2|nr:glutaredoxin [Pseudomonadota bacterium]